MTASFDIAIIGSGFAGSLLASIARSLGKSAILIERGEHPRFTIGESSTPLANLLIETLADRYQLPWLRPFSKWGTWQATYPNIGCGLKRGFSFFHHKASHNWSFDPITPTNYWSPLVLQTLSLTPIGIAPTLIFFFKRKRSLAVRSTPIKLT